jgi:hypothetical protein
MDAYKHFSSCVSTNNLGEELESSLLRSAAGSELGRSGCYQDLKRLLPVFELAGAAISRI